MGFGIGINDVATNLFEILKEVLIMKRGIRENKIVTGLFFEHRKINAFALDARGGSGLKAQELDADLLKRGGKTLGG